MGNKIMRHVKLSGWNRIGITLSIIWLLLIWTYTLIEYHQEETETTFFRYVVDDKSKPIWGTIEPSGKTAKAVPLKRVLCLNPFLAISFIPIIGVWLISYVAFWTIRWISKGFKNKST